MRMRALGVQLEETRRELAAAKGELDEAERKRVAEIREMSGQVMARERELAAVKGELAQQKDAIREQDDVAGRRIESEMREFKEEMRAELARGREERREVLELDWPRAITARVKACRNWVNVEVEINQSEGDQKTAWEDIKSASQGTELSLSQLKGLSDAMLAHVSTMSHLTSINLCCSSGFTAEGIKHLYMLPRLERLNLRRTGVSDSALEGIRSLVSLKKLYLYEAKMTDAGLLHLTALSSLKELELSECKGVTDAGMVHVGRLTGLEKLWLCGTAVSDDGVLQLTALTKLRCLITPDGGIFMSDAARMQIDK
ncbi:unnamed protein product [Closterium sp. Yama58-4]|nr:unnamed protein product [Closterium sp. Yama58-4]